MASSHWMKNLIFSLLAVLGNFRARGTPNWARRAHVGAPDGPKIGQNSNGHISLILTPIWVFLEALESLECLPSGSDTNIG